MTRPAQPDSMSTGAHDFDSVFREHAATVSRWVANLGGPLLDVEDTVQEIFMIAHRRLPDFRGDAKISTWLFQIARRVVLAQRRRSRWRRWLGGSAEEVAGRIPATALSPIEEVERKQAVRQVHAVLDRMSEKYRTVLVLAKLEGLDVEEIAVVSGVASVTVRVWLHRARAQFQRLVSEGGGE